MLKVENDKLYSAKQIADWLICYNQEFVDTYQADLLSHLKIQKLLYYAQAASLALNNKALFKEPIFAWDYGPVVKKVYNAYKKFGANGISKSEIDNQNAMLDVISTSLMKGVYDKYNKFSAQELYKKTHNEAPWKNTNRNKEILKDTIKDYFVNIEYKQVLTGELFADIPIVQVDCP